MGSTVAAQTGQTDQQTVDPNAQQLLAPSPATKPVEAAPEPAKPKTTDR